MSLCSQIRRLFRGEDGLPSFQHLVTRDYHKLNLYSTSEAIVESIMFTSIESDRAAS